MADLALYPFTAFNFSVEIYVPAMSRTLCQVSFSEIDGLDMTMDVKTVREGGNNQAQIRLVGAVSYGQVTMKRGVTSNFDLWNWFTAIQQAPAAKVRDELRAHAEIVVMAPDRRTKRVSFVLERCLPVKVKAPGLNAKDGGVAIEEMQLTYESMTVVPGEAS